MQTSIRWKHNNVYHRFNGTHTLLITSHGLDWIVQCFTSPPTQYRLHGRRFLQVKRPNQQYQSTEGNATKDKSNNENNKIHICTVTSDG